MYKKKTVLILNEDCVFLIFFFSHFSLRFLLVIAAAGRAIAQRTSVFCISLTLTRSSSVLSFAISVSLKRILHRLTPKVPSSARQPHSLAGLAVWLIYRLFQMGRVASPIPCLDYHKNAGKSSSSFAPFLSSRVQQQRWPSRPFLRHNSDDRLLRESVRNFRNTHTIEQYTITTLLLVNFFSFFSHSDPWIISILTRNDPGKCSAITTPRCSQGNWVDRSTRKKKSEKRKLTYWRPRQNLRDNNVLRAAVLYFTGARKRGTQIENGFFERFNTLFTTCRQIDEYFIFSHPYRIQYYHIKV